jgi:nucleotide-binding universal stress UspA family protein
VPSKQDVQALLTGAYVPPGRLRQGWILLNLWLTSLSRASTAVALDTDGWVAVEWELARAGLNSDYAVRSLFDRPLGLPLPPLPGQVAGYAKHVHAVETLEALAEAAPRADLPAEARDAVAAVVEVLRVAAEHGLDVVVIGAPD